MRIGGIVGNTNGQVSHCTNTGKIIAERTDIQVNVFAGGVIGQAGGDVYFCDNYGPVNARGSFVGGVVGFAGNMANNITLCNNYGSISVNGNAIGGVVGTTYKANEISLCSNRGYIDGGYYIGGILGMSSTDSQGKVTKCYNSGTIKSSGSSDGGIVGICGDNMDFVTKCYNKGDIICNGRKGEVIGVVRSNTVLNNLYYLSRQGGTGKAIDNIEDSETNKIMAVTDDLTFEQFKTWVETL